MWPSSRLPWPPPVSLRVCRGVGAAWVRCRERHRQDLPRGRRTRVHERVHAGFGSRIVQPPRWSSSGGSVTDGLSLFGGAQLAIDTTLVSALRRDGTAREGAANRNGVAIRSAHRRMERTYPEFAGAGGRARLVILAGEVGGRCRPRQRTSCGLWQLRRLGTFPAQTSVEVAWFRRWSNILSCAAARAFADSLLEVRGAGGAGGNVPSSHDVVRDNRF